MELNDIIAIMATPIYIELVKKNVKSDTARSMAITEAHALWKEVVKK